MEMKDFKEQWKKELNTQLILTKEEKSQMIHQIKTGRNKNRQKRNWTYKTVLVGFTVIALFLMMITINDRSFTVKTTSTGSSNLTDLDISLNFSWFLLIYFLTLLAMTVFIITMLKTARWNNKKWIGKYAERKNIFLLIIFYLLLAIPIFIVVNRLQIIYLQLWLVLLVTVLNCLYFLWCIRDCEQATCPHCGCKFSNSKTISMSWKSIRTKCENCKERIYHSTSSKKKNAAIFPVPFVTYFLLSFFQFPYVFILMSFLLNGLFFNLYISKFTMSFSKEDEPLW